MNAGKSVDIGPDDCILNNSGAASARIFVATPPAKNSFQNCFRLRVSLKLWDANSLKNWEVVQLAVHQILDAFFGVSKSFAIIGKPFGMSGDRFIRCYSVSSGFSPSSQERVKFTRRFF